MSKSRAFWRFLLAALVLMAAAGCAPPPGQPSDTQAPGEVELLSAVSGNGAAKLSWIDPIHGDFDTIQITWSPGQDTPQVVAPNVQTYTAAGLANGTRYTLAVRTVDASGNVSAGSTVSATPALQWAFGGSADDEAHSMRPASDGGYIVAGSTASSDLPYLENHGQRDFYLVKLDSTCALAWQKEYGGIADDEAYSAQQTTDGGYIVAGYSESGGGYFPDDFYVMKLDANGNCVNPETWTRTYGGSNIDRGHAILQTLDGGYIVGGYSYSTDIAGAANNGSADYYVIKLDSTGNVIWQKLYGGSGRDEAWSIMPTSDGGYILAGSSDSANLAGLTNSGYTDFYVVKLDSDGAVTWQNMFGGSLPDYGYSIEQTADGGYILGGSTQTALGGGVDCVIAKLDSGGDISWQKSFGGESSSWDWARCVQQTSDGGYIVAGRKVLPSLTGGCAQCWLTQLDSSGNIVSEWTYGGVAGSEAVAVVQKGDGGYIVAGQSGCADIPGVTSHGGLDFFILDVN